MLVLIRRISQDSLSGKDKLQQLVNYPFLMKEGLFEMNARFSTIALWHSEIVSQSGMTGL